MTERATAKAIPVVAHMYGVMEVRNLAKKRILLLRQKLKKPEYSPSYVNTCSFTGQSVVDS